MTGIFYIAIALLAFGVMIAIHEAGHFFAAKACGVKVYEFSLGMGPKLFARVGKGGTKYALRLLPIGGYVSMEGEDDASDDERAFCNKKWWKKFSL